MWFETIAHQQGGDLRQINELGMQKAAEALSQLLRQPVKLMVSGEVAAGQLQTELVQSELGLGVYIGVNGVLSGGILLFFSKASADWLSCQLLGQRKIENLLDEPASSTLKEVGNIVVSAFLASLDTQLNLRALPSPPQLFLAPLAELLKQQPESQHSLCQIVCNHSRGAAETEDRLLGNIYFFPETESLDLSHERVASEKS